tara:strand:- start:392 stop:691 length:300 start_codon:yes stop_codon:yes gene_type:complete
MSVNLSEYMSERLPKTRHVGPDSREWEPMWERMRSKLANGNLGPWFLQSNALTGDDWQYMGTVVHGESDGAYEEHEFRHRNHPRTHKREYMRVRMWRKS